MVEGENNATSVDNRLKPEKLPMIKFLHVNENPSTEIHNVNCSVHGKDVITKYQLDESTILDTRWPGLDLP